MARTDGIDVSKWQGNINWGQVEATGIQWAATRASLGRSTDDPFLKPNMAGMDAAAFRTRLVYHWITPGSTAGSQVDWFMRQMGGRIPAGWGVMLDAERNGDVDPPAALCDEWCRRVEAVTGRPVVVYSGVYVDGGRIMRMARDSGRPFILASYNSESWTATRVRELTGSTWPQACAAWQWTGKGTIAGVNGPVDCDQVHDWAAFDRACGVAIPTPAPAPTPAPQPAPAPAPAPAFTIPDGDPVLKRSDPMMRGSEVRDLQHALNVFKYGNIAEDGIFGDATKAAVGVAQTALKVKRDFEYGPITAREWRDTWARFLRGMPR